jgi:alkanesulfonate monooxygenase SsuD/methylene tetrahydromethanopterin reductase-like flavin-dependent oxidoreductase (luciferase family)
MSDLWSPAEQAGVDHTFREAVVGSPATVQRGLARFLERTKVDELMVTAAIHDQTARLHSLALVAQLREVLEPTPAAGHPLCPPAPSA